MKLFVKIALGFLLGLILIAAAGAFVLRESLGTEARFDYQSPRDKRFRVEIYESAGFGGDPSFSVFALESGVRKYLGEMDGGQGSVWSDDLHWSNDGGMIYCGTETDGAAYLFGVHKLIRQRGQIWQDEIASLLSRHGGPGVSFFNWRDDSAVFVWRDFVPQEAH